jgi:hypothetical protein
VTLVCFASFKGSPGTTLTALATAAAWPSPPDRRKLLLEADADGGTLAIRYRLPTKPGLLSLAAAARHGLAPEQVWDHAQLLPGGLPVVLGPEGPEQATEVLRSNGRDLGQWLRSLQGVDVIADVGRLSLGSAAFELARSADAVLGVARPEATQLQPAAQRMLALGPYGPRVGWVLIGEKPYSAQAVTDAFGLPVVHVVADDRRGARLLESGSNPAKLRRSTLVRSVTGLAESLAAWLHPAADAADDDGEPLPAPPPAPSVPAPAPVSRSVLAAASAADVAADTDADIAAIANFPPPTTSRNGTHEPPEATVQAADEPDFAPPDRASSGPPSLAILAARRSRDLTATDEEPSALDGGGGDLS